MMIQYWPNYEYKKHLQKKKFPLAPMGVLAPVSAHAGHSAQPPIGASDWAEKSQNGPFLQEGFVLQF